MFYNHNINHIYNLKPTDTLLCHICNYLIKIKYAHSISDYGSQSNAQQNQRRLLHKPHHRKSPTEPTQESRHGFIWLLLKFNNRKIKTEKSKSKSKSKCLTKTSSESSGFFGGSKFLIVRHYN